MSEAQEIDKVLKVVNGYSTATLNQIKIIPEAMLVRIVAGQLKSCVKAHGPITNEQIGSAAKRIATQLLAAI